MTIQKKNISGCDLTEKNRSGLDLTEKIDPDLTLQKEIEPSQNIQKKKIDPDPANKMSKSKGIWNCTGCFANIGGTLPNSSPHPQNLR